MTELIVLRILGDVCLYFAVVGAFPLFFSHDFMLLYPALLCAAGAGAAALLERKRPGALKYGALILPLLSLLLADEAMEYLILIPVLLYTGAVVHRGAYDLEYYSFRDQFVNAGRLLCVFGGLVFALGYFEGMFGASWDTYDISSVLLYGLTYGFSGVFLLRQLRLGVDCRPKDRVANNVQMILVLVVILVLSMMAVALEESMREVISWLLYTVLAAAAVIPMVLHEILRWFLRTDGGAYIEAVATARSEPTESVEYTFPVYQGPPQAPPAEEEFPWWFAILVLAVLCCAVFFLLRTLKKPGGHAASGEELETVDGPGEGRRGSNRSNRSKVRKLYRSYLKLVRRKGQKLEKDQTTADILEKHPENTNAEAAARLRQVYLKARYDTEAPVTDRDVELAKTAMKRVTDHHKAR